MSTDGWGTAWARGPAQAVVLDPAGAPPLVAGVLPGRVPAPAPALWPAISAQASFAAVCAQLIQRGGAQEMNPGFPLRRHVRLRSDLSLSFLAREFKLEEAGGAAPSLPTLRIGFLTLAGLDGALPVWLNQKLLHSRNEESRALHAFLDLLNQRFWELAFLARTIEGNAQFHQRADRAGEVGAQAVGAVTGVANEEIAESGASTSWVRPIQRLCAATMGGRGGIDLLARQLSKMLDCRLEIKEHQPVRLPTGVRGRSLLGRTPAPQRTLGQGAALGRSAWVACALTVCVTHPSKLEAYLPGTRASRLPTLKRWLATLYASCAPPWRLIVRSMAAPSHSTLGNGGVRLGWGASLGNPRASSQLIRVSRGVLHSLSTTN
ncbi:type VI secretion system baseplate subunit TssG [Variovorax saccharolyticus]|uniref:type VI secretion system baseplate subunit TssG n=1 Tax=Variovorax saccharolyticus TaxID=3053516 RepID=UPI0025781A15|nr:type VI secretion system baseplate subunit TssG [Variovorax sp. J31P216]MDM0029795.1 type VI secretion system baseplate subunit TssG [Variovorax sp. J31P216]